jgi:hypothetical protein
MCVCVCVSVRVYMCTCLCVYVYLCGHLSHHLVSSIRFSSLSPSLSLSSIPSLLRTHTILLYPLRVSVPPPLHTPLFHTTRPETAYKHWRSSMQKSISLTVPRTSLQKQQESCKSPNHIRKIMWLEGDIYIKTGGGDL